MTTRYINPATQTCVTIEVIRDEEFEAFLSDNKHLERVTETPGAQQAAFLQDSTWRFKSAQGFSIDSARGKSFDGLLYDHRQYEYEAFDQMLDDDDLMQGEIEDAYYNSFLRPDIRTQTRNAVINQKKFDGWFRPGRAQRRAKRNRKDIALSKLLNARYRRPSLRREVLA